jgi:archaemetzincin
LPKAAGPGRRHRGEDLLALVGERLPPEPGPGVRIVGVTAADVWAAKGAKAARSVFGLAELGGPSALISTHRLRQGARDRAQLTFRVGSAAVHQLGHTFGLGHCQESRCAMLDDGEGIHNTDAGDGHLGRQCRGQLAAVPSPL